MVSLLVVIMAWLNSERISVLSMFSIGAIRNWEDLRARLLPGISMLVTGSLSVFSLLSSMFCPARRLSSLTDPRELGPLTNILLALSFTMTSSPPH